MPGKPVSSRPPVRGTGGGGSPPPKTPRTRMQPSSPRKRRHLLRRSLLLLVLVLVLSGGIFGYKILAASNKITATDRSILGQLKDLLFKHGNSLTGETEDRINVLFIAIGGEGHSGQNLADTVMVASFRPSDKAVGLMSIPRDLYVQVPDEEYYTKINAVHAYGESQKKGGGPLLLKKKVEDITGMPIQYYARIDFTAFKQIVDAVGGINITIENSFFDYWHKISFPASTEKMNGERALAYVRARYIEGPEGGDFKRAARQQQVLLALREKVFSVNTAFDFAAVNSILNSLSDNIRTDMELWEMKRFYELARDIDQAKVNSVVLTTGPKGALVGSTEVLSGVPASILKPRTGDYSEIHSLMQNIFVMPSGDVAQQDLPAPPPEETEATPEPTAEVKPSIEVRNGTNVTGLAKEVSTQLEEQEYTVTTIGNAANRSRPETTVYAIKPNIESSAKIVAELLEAQADIGLPEGEQPTNADVLVILGANAAD
ncbi:MAG: LCP family protein [Candidatus Andersenbacteria bacterium]